MDQYISEIRFFAGAVLPEGWAYCNGQTLPIANNEALFSLLGTNFGGNGVSTFGLPDLRGRLPVGQGQGTGLTNRVLGQTGGSEQVAVTVSQIPTHSHAFNASSDNANTNSPKNAAFANPQPNGFYDATPFAGSVPQVLYAGSVTTDGGSGANHENRMPAMTINYIISTTGIFPEQPQ